VKKFASKTFLLLTIFLLLLSAPPDPVFADGGGHEFTRTVNGYQVTLGFARPVTVGENSIHIRVSNAHDLAIPNADVQVGVVAVEAEHSEAEPVASSKEDMHGMSDMSEGHTEEPSDAHDKMGMVALQVGHESGEYSGEIAFDSAGDCTVRVHLTIQDEFMEVDFPMSVARPQNSYGILAGFFALNALIIVSAVALKPKPVSVPSSNEG